MRLREVMGGYVDVTRGNVKIREVTGAYVRLREVRGGNVDVTRYYGRLYRA